MRYFVIATDGQKYGPADIATLQTWVNQGRVLHQTVLEEEMTGTRLSASAVGSLQFGGGAPTAAPPTQTYVPPTSPYGSAPSNPYQQNPYGNTNYYRPGGGPAYLNDPRAQEKINHAWIGFGLGLACCAPFAIWGLLSAQEAKKYEHPQAQAALVCNIVALCLWGAGLLFNLFGVFSMM
ncbi:MAG: hypothetical protein ABL949_03365 [Fimbriimonadaceae bacterium]